MNMPSFRRRRVSLTIALAALASWATAQSAISETQPKRTWADFGFDGAPEGLSTDEITLIENLNKSRGSWSFKGSAREGDDIKPVKAQLQILGSAKDGMLPMWRMVLGWPAGAAREAITYVLMVAPDRESIDLMLIRIGPTEVGNDGAPTRDAVAKAQRTAFDGTWHLESRTVLWKEEDVQAGQPGLSFEMAVADSGEITIQPHRDAGKHPGLTGKAIARIGEPLSEEKLAFNKDSHYETHADISDPRAKPCLPPEATDITLRLERGGHFARYQVSEEAFHRFLESLWRGNAQGPGEGEAAEAKAMARFERLNWKPLQNAMLYQSPPKPNGAMTSYYYDREAGVAYHSAGYW